MPACPWEINSIHCVPRAARCFSSLQASAGARHTIPKQRPPSFTHSTNCDWSILTRRNTKELIHQPRKRTHVCGWDLRPTVRRPRPTTAAFPWMSLVASLDSAFKSHLRIIRCKNETHRSRWWAALGLKCPLSICQRRPRGLLRMSRDSRAPLRTIIKVQRMVKGAVKKVELVQRGFTFCIWPVREALHCCMYNLFLYESMGRGAYVGVYLIEILNKKDENPWFPTFFYLCNIQSFRLASCLSLTDKPRLSP